MVWVGGLATARIDNVPLGLLQDATVPAAPQWLSNTQRGADVVQKVVTAGAIVVGGIWAYYKFVRGRIFVSNLELTITGEVTSKDDVINLVATAIVKNIGTGKLEVYHHPLTVMRVLAPRAVSSVRVSEVSEWVSIKTLRLFEDQTHFEPAEPAVDAHLVLVSKHEDYTALKLEVIVVSDEKKDVPLEKKMLG